MRTAICSAMLAVLPALCVGTSSAQNTPPQEARPQQEAAKAQAPPADARKTAEPAPGATDPGKLAAKPDPTSPAAVDNTIYVLGADDMIQIRVWGDERLSGQYLIRPDGRISMPLLGEIVATGKTPDGLSREIENTLKERQLLMRPLAVVQVTSPMSKKYRINGEVNKPGAFPLTHPITIRDALVEAGGFKDFANMKDIRILRGDKIFHFNWKDMLKGKHKEQNIYLEPGDLIIVK